MPLSRIGTCGTSMWLYLRHKGENQEREKILHFRFFKTILHTKVQALPRTISIFILVKYSLDCDSSSNEMR